MLSCFRWQAPYTNQISMSLAREINLVVRKKPKIYQSQFITSIASAECIIAIHPILAHTWIFHIPRPIRESHLAFLDPIMTSIINKAPVTLVKSLLQLTCMHNNYMDQKFFKAFFSPQIFHISFILTLTSLFLISNHLASFSMGPFTLILILLQ